MVATLEGFEKQYEEQSKFVRQLVREVRHGRNRLAEFRQSIANCSLSSFNKIRQRSVFVIRQ